MRNEMIPQPIAERLRRDPRLYRRAANLFLSVADLELAEQARALAAHAAADEDLLDAVQWLLAQENNVGEFLDPASGERIARHTQGQLEEWLGRQVGVYRIGSLLGAGGMGLVFEAERNDEVFSKKVAIKVLPSAAVSPGARRRFELERQILAALEHPAIARLLDGGTTREGLPYLVMELVSGRPITEHCDADGLSTRRRVRLFCSVLHAVHAAHQAMVAHRDVKPANILVTEEGFPKLLDFGISKLLDESGETATQDRILTRDYASPEQLAGRQVTAATDIYSLGIVLYELLCGRRPDDRSSRSPGEIVDHLQRREVAPPSRAVGDMELEDAEAVAHARGTTVTGLRRELKGDLDAVVMKSLRFESENRYSSVDQMRQDLVRYLTGHPVIARAPSLGYRLGKLVRRHVVVTAILAVLVPAVVLGLVMSAAQARRVQAERDRAQAVVDFMVGAFRLAGPDRARGPTITAKELLDRCVDRLDPELQARPSARAAVMHNIGVVYRDLGFYDDAVVMLEGAVEQRRRLSSEALLLASSLEELSYAEIARGHFEPAETLAWEAMEKRSALLPASSHLVADSLHNLGLVQQKLGHLQQAEEYLRDALSAHQTAPRDDKRVVRDLNALVDVLTGAGGLEEAEIEARQAVELSRRVYEAPHPETLSAAKRLVHVLVDRGAFADAEPLARDVVELSRELLGGDHPDVAEATHDHAYVLDRMGRREAARPLYEEALRRAATALGEDHPDLAVIRLNLAGLHRVEGEFGAAIRLHHEALDILREALGGSHPRVALALNDYASTLLAKGDLQEAGVLYREALQIFRQTLGAEHPNVAMVLNNLGALLQELGDFTAADALYRESLDIARRVFGETHPHVARLVNNLGVLASEWGRLTVAEDLHRRSLEILEQIDGIDEAYVGRTKHDLGCTLRRMGRLEEAEAVLMEALASRRQVLGDDHSETLETRLWLATVDFFRGDPAARSEILEVISGLRHSLGEAHPKLASALVLAGEVHLADGDLGLAEAYCRRALEIFESRLPADHWRIAKAQSILKEVMALE